MEGGLFSYLMLALLLILIGINILKMLGVYLIAWLLLYSPVLMEKWDVLMHGDISKIHPDDLNLVVYYDRRIGMGDEVGYAGLLFTIVLLMITLGRLGWFRSLVLSLFAVFIAGKGLPNLRGALAHILPELSPIFNSPALFIITTLAVPLTLKVLYERKVKKE